VILESAKIFSIGVLEDFLSAFNTKTIQRNDQIFSFFTTFASIIISCYVIVMVADNLEQFWLVLVYAFGGGFGDIVTIKCDSKIERFEKALSRLFKTVRLRCPIVIVRGRKRLIKQKKRRAGRGVLGWLGKLFRRNHKYRRKNRRKKKGKKS
jgi:uncharacterized protein YebE (UPF0316 family)